MSEYTDYVTHSNALAVAGMHCDEQDRCCSCQRDVTSCAVCGVCRECHDKARYWHMAQLSGSWECEAMGRRDALLRSLSDAELSEFAEAEDVSEATVFHVRAEQGYRHSLKRARELGADCYCGAHDCDTRNCPPGSHGDA